MTHICDKQPQKAPDGRWMVDGLAFDTNASAWRYIDRRDCEPVSRAEHVSDWIFNKQANGE